MNVMVRAWEIARAAAEIYEGKAKEFFAQALVMAWAESKNPTVPTKLEWTLKANTRKTRTWIAHITGTHPIFKLARSFLQEEDTDQYGDKVFLLPDGFYEINNGKRREFVRVEVGQYTFVRVAEVTNAVAEMEAS